jgi:SAM-dependent methyltransferase
MFDFDAALGQAGRPPLPHADASFDQIRANEAFTRLVDDWAEWLLEARRLLADGGRLEIGLSLPESFDELTDHSWDESRIGMTVVSALDGPGHRLVFHSEWWIRAHWGRAFDVVSIDEQRHRG